MFDKNKESMEGIGGKIKTIPEDFIVEEIPKKTEKEGKDHLVFWVEKRNIDTLDVIRILSKKLKVSRKRFGYAGTKDKFAIAKQRISVWDPDGEVEKDIRSLDFKRFRVYGFERNGRLNLGDLEGNHFIITIRDIELGKSELEKKLKKIENEIKKGIPNYFGVQRFGGIRPITHLVGLEMLKGNFEEAVKIYVAEPYKGESESVRKIRERLLKNWGDREIYLWALKEFPKKFRYERLMLEYLYKYPKDYVGALRRIPKKMRKLFINAVQSWIFNEVLFELEKEKTLEELKNVKIPLVGFDTVLNPKNDVHKKVIEAMKSLEIEKSDFLMKSMPEMKTTGNERNAVIEIKDFKVKEISEDELNPGKMKTVLEFTLPPGSYATVVLEKIMRGKITVFY